MKVDLNDLINEDAIYKILIVYILATDYSFSDIAKHLIEHEATNLNLMYKNGWTSLMNGTSSMLNSLIKI